VQQKLIRYFSPASKRTVSVLSTVAAIVDEYKFLSNWLEAEFQGWTLPAIAEPHCWCGLYATKACLKNELHKKLGKGNLIYIKQYQNSCYRAVCKICYLKWIVRQANSATQKIEYYSKKTGKKPIHLILIANLKQQDLPVKLLRQRMSHILKIAEVECAAVVFHPFRFKEEKRLFYPWPHFHLVCFGTEQKIRKAFGKYGWFVKNEGERESVFQTFCYILSHCGVKKGYQTVTWFRKSLLVKSQDEEEPKITCCPVCGADFEEVYFDGEYDPVVPPDKPYEGLVEPEGWYPVNTIPEVPKSPDFEYSPYKELDDTLKGIALAN